MDFLRTARFCLLLLSLNSCAKVGYLASQGKGQLALQMKAKANEVVLADPRIPSENKRQIRLIEAAKSYFYDYYQRPATQIYSKTTFLSGEMVTTLVIASPYDRIEAREECFPFMGCFPYLGFFDPEDAKSYARKLEEQNFVTFSRPVYAYSTLGYFDDNILSSFFHYDDAALVELVFHELFHTIFFVKGEVDLNENLANYFGAQMVSEYFKWDEKERSRRQKREEVEKELIELVVAGAARLSKRYEATKSLGLEESQVVLRTFLEGDFRPTLESFCAGEGLAGNACWPLSREWNNASFAAFLTYEKKARHIEKLHHELKLDLKGLYQLLEKTLACYDKLAAKEKEGLTFEELLFKERVRLCRDI